MSLGPDTYTIIERLTSKLIQAIDAGATVHTSQDLYSSYVYKKIGNEYVEWSARSRSNISIEQLEQTLDIAFDDPFNIGIIFNEDKLDSEIYKWWVNLKDSLGENMRYDGVIWIDPLKVLEAYNNFFL